MMSRQATLIIADEIYFNLHGKAILQGIYNTDLVIPSDPSNAAQLLFYFIIETDITDPFKNLSVEFTLPGSPPVRQFIFVPPPEVVAAIAKSQPQRNRFTVKHPVLIPGPTLRAGRIEAKVITESDEIPITPQWIILNPALAAAAPARAN
jgi:hypothetical protein